MVYSNTAVYEEHGYKNMGKFIQSLVYFHLFEALNLQFFQGLIFTPYQRHW